MVSETTLMLNSVSAKVNCICIASGVHTGFYGVATSQVIGSIVNRLSFKL